MAVTFVMFAGCGGRAEVPPPAETSVNEILARQPLTFVVGTLGDAPSDATVARQASMVAAMFPGATVVLDTAFTWPREGGVVMYGGPHVNAAVRDLAPRLPLELGPGRLALGDKVFTGDDVRLIAAIPVGAAADGSARDAFVLYAGTGQPGVAEINAVRHGPEAIVVADTFGRLTTGRWVARDGRVTAELAAPARRIGWRDAARALATPSGPAAVRFRFPDMVPAAADEAALIEAGLRGLATVVARLELTRVEPVDVYVYPDRRSKQSLTGDGGDGHAVPAAHALHVVAAPPEALERLMAHEGTHVLTVATWGTAGTPLLGEGLAVWVAGGYAGTPLAELRLAAGERPSLEAAVLTFRKLPERVGYSYGGQLVAAMVELGGGLARVRDHVYGASAQSWRADWGRAGLVPEVVEADVAKRLRPPGE